MSNINHTPRATEQNTVTSEKGGETSYRRYSSKKVVFGTALLTEFCCIPCTIDMSR